MEEQLELQETYTTTTLRLILHNDNVNSFQRVIVVIVLLMGYDVIRAEQLATIAHHKGTATLMEGKDIDYLLMMQMLFRNENLTVTIE